MAISDLLGTIIQSGMTNSSNQRMRSALESGSGALLESLGALFSGKKGIDLGEVLSSVLGDGSKDLAGMFGNVLNQAGDAVGGKHNLALGGLAALAGSLLGGGKKSLGGAIGGGLMALLGAMAFKALQGSGQGTGQVPLGLMKPQNESSQRELEQNTELVLKAMINAAKADGQIDETEIRRITGELQEAGADPEDQRYVINEMNKPMETEMLISAARGNPELGVQIYAASLMAIEVDTPAEKEYMEKLALGLGLTPEVTQRVQEMVGLQTA